MKRGVIIVAILASVIMAGIIVMAVANYLEMIHRDHHPSSEFSSSAFSLHSTQDYWLSHGRPTDFQPGQYLGLPNEFFVYTNLIKTSNTVFRCRFGARRPGWPPGVLAITDENAVIFISDQDGKVTLSPDENGVDP